MKAKATLYYILAGYSNIIYSIISGLILVPFYLKDFGSEVYGAWLATGNLVAWLGILGGSLSIVFAQKVAKAQAAQDIKGFRETVGSGIILFSLLSIFIVAGICAVGDLFLGMFDIKPENYQSIRTALQISALASSVTVFHSLFIYILGSWFKNSHMLHATLIGGAVGIILNIVLLILGYGLLSIPLSLLAKAIVILLWLFRPVQMQWSRHQIGLPIFGLSHAKTFFISSGPIMLSNIASIGINHSQATIIGILFGPSAATVVAITDKLYSLVKTFIYPIGNAFLQPLSSLLGSPEKFQSVSRRFVHQTDMLALFCILACFIINQTFITLWVGAEHYAGDLVSAALAFSALLIIRVNNLVSVLNAKGEFKITSLYMVTDLVIRFIMLCILYFIAGLTMVLILPIAEIIGIIMASKVTLARKISLNARRQWIVYLTFFSIFTCLTIGTFLPQQQLFFKISSMIIAISLATFAVFQIWQGNIVHEIRLAFSIKDKNGLTDI